MAYRRPEDGGRITCNILSFARIRPPGEEHATVDHSVTDQEEDGGDQIKRLTVDKHHFPFSNVFEPSSQEDVFENVAKSVVNRALDGYNGTIFAYGQTGSGKTYTVTGGEHYKERGIIPRAVAYVYQQFEKRIGVSYNCFVSYLGACLPFPAYHIHCLGHALIFSLSQKSIMRRYMIC